MVDNYITKSNLQRLLLFNKLITRPELGELTIQEIKLLVDDCVTCIDNSNNTFENGKIKLSLDDRNNLFNSMDAINSILELTFLEFEPTFVEEKEQKKQLFKRWGIEK